MKGLPSPEKVRSWWEDRDPPPEGGDHANHADHPDREGPNPHTYEENGDRHPPDQSPISDRSLTPEDRTEPKDADRDQQVIGNSPISDNGTGKPKTGSDEDVIGAIGMIGGSEPVTEKENGSLTADQVRRYRRLVAEGMSAEFAAAAVRGEEVDL